MLRLQTCRGPNSECGLLQFPSKKTVLIPCFKVWSDRHRKALLSRYVCSRKSKRPHPSPLCKALEKTRYPCANRRTAAVKSLVHRNTNSMFFLLQLARGKVLSARLLECSYASLLTLRPKRSKQSKSSQSAPPPTFHRCPKLLPAANPADIQCSIELLCENLTR